MRWQEIREAEDESGRFRASINMNSFYSNMQLLQRTTDPDNVPSELEGIDAVVRLGYLGSIGTESIVSRLGTSLPTQTGFGGYYDSADDELVIAWDSVFEPGDRMPGVSTTAHELRHRAFQIMSIDPRFDDLLPEELTTGIWSDGWGRNVDWRKYKIIPQLEPYASDPIASTKGIMVVPEHAMIYCVQHRDILSHEKAEWVNNSVLGNRGPEYWRDLYSRVNEGVKTFFRQHFDARATPAMYPSRGSRAGTIGDIFQLTPEMKAYYTAWAKLTDFDLIFVKMTSTNVAVADVMGTSRQPWMIELKRIWESAHTADLVDWEQEFTEEMSKNSSTLNVLKIVQGFKKHWQRLDIRQFTPDQVRTIIDAPTATAPPAVPVQPVTPPRNPQNPPLPVPTGRTISFKQFAQNARYGNRTLWQHLLASANSAALQSAINEVLVQAAMVDLSLDRSTQRYIDTLLTVFPALTPENRPSIIDLYLEKVLLNRR